MKYCEEYAALLDLYVDGELSPEEMAAVQEHLDQCPDCRRYVDEILEIRAAFPDVEEASDAAGQVTDPNKNQIGTALDKTEFSEEETYIEPKITVFLKMLVLPQ